MPHSKTISEREKILEEKIRERKEEEEKIRERKEEEEKKRTRAADPVEPGGKANISIFEEEPVAGNITPNRGENSVDSADNTDRDQKKKPKEEKPEESTVTRTGGSKKSPVDERPPTIQKPGGQKSGGGYISSPDQATPAPPEFQPTPPPIWGKCPEVRATECPKCPPAITCAEQAMSTPAAIMAGAIGALLLALVCVGAGILLR